MNKPRSWIKPSFLIAFSFIALSACDRRDFKLQQIPRVASNQEARVRFQQIYLSFKEINPAQARSKKETEKLAKEIFEAATKRPSEFPDLVRKYSEDPFPAVYALVNYGQAPQEGERERDDFYPAVGLKAFEMKVGEIALVPYHPEGSPAGFHILMRLPN